MELSAALVADLAALSAGLDEPDADLALLVLRMGETCALAIESYLGFSITLVVGELPVSFSVLHESLDPNDIRTSLMFGLGEHQPGSEVVLYAGVPGALVDLAADLTYLMGVEPDSVKLDQHLTPVDPDFGASGVAILSRQNQAIGILLDRGHELDEAVIELHRLAALEGISVDSAAQKLIESTVRRPD